MGVDAENASCLISTDAGYSLCWSQGKWVREKLVLPRTSIWHPMKVTIGGEECFVGGQDSDDDVSASLEASCYEKGKFVSKPEYALDVARAHTEGVTLILNGMLCLVGGFETDSDSADLSKSSMCWNTTTKKWHHHSQYDLTTPRAYSGLLNYKGMHCLVGGAGLGLYTSQCLRTAECFDTSLHGGLGGWKAMSSLSLPPHYEEAGSCSAATLVLNGTQCLVGGFLNPKDILCLDEENEKLVKKHDLDGDGCYNPVVMTLDGLKCITNCKANGTSAYCITAAGHLKENQKYGLPIYPSFDLVWNLSLS